MSLSKLSLLSHISIFSPLFAPPRQDPPHAVLSALSISIFCGGVEKRQVTAAVLDVLRHIVHFASMKTKG